MQTESELISSILAGHPDAFRELVRRYERLVSVMVSRVLQGQRDEADVRQEVFVRIYRKLHTFKYKSTLATWIAQVAYRASLNHVKSTDHRAKRTVDAGRVPEPANQDAGPVARLETKDVTAFVHRQVNRLPLPYRTVVTLYHLHELSYAEIAGIMDLPEGTVKSYLFRARQLLKERLKSYKSGYNE